MEIIYVRSLTKKFGVKTVLDNVSLSVKSGCSTVLLGPNGAGKTTLISILTGLQTQYQGQVKLFGQLPGSLGLRHFVACSPQQSSFPPEAKVYETISLVASHYSNPLSLEVLNDHFGIKTLLSKKNSHLSGGEARRVTLACTFVGRPKLVFLDEPTTAIDTEMKKKIWQFFKQYQNQGGSLLLTTHDLDEAETVAQEIIILNKGKIIKQGTKQEISDKANLKSMTFKCDQFIADVDLQKDDTNYLWVGAHPEGRLRSLLNQYDILDLSIQKLPLEQVIQDVFEKVR